MSVPFARTLRAVDTSGRGRVAGALVGLLLAGLWFGWVALARVTLYEQSTAARLEAAGGTRRLATEVPGRIATVEVAVGDVVEAGQVLVRLDDAEATLRLDRAQESVAAVEAQQEAARLAVDAARRAASERGSVSAVALQEAEARVREARVLGELAARRASRSAQLVAGGAVSTAAVEEDRTTAEARAAAAASAESAQARTALEQRVEASEQRARLATMERELAALADEQVRAASAVAVLELELDRHVLRSPVAGRVLRLEDIAPGELVTRGQELVEVVPGTELFVRATFAPGQAIGRIRPGQPARVRLEGFPWTAFGELHAEVDRVSGTSPATGAVEVQLALTGNDASPIPLEHGLIGDVEVAVETVSPAQLALRAAGGLRRTRSSAP